MWVAILVYFCDCAYGQWLTRQCKLLFLSETKQKILNTDGYLKNQSPGLRRNLDHHVDICPRHQNVGRTNYHVIGRENLETLNLRQRERLKPMAELRLNSEIIGNFRNFEKFLGPLVEHQK